jgi:fatty-acyl-CoA synthase
MNLDTLTIRHVLVRTHRYFPRSEVVERVGEGQVRRFCYAELAEEAIRFANGLRSLGVREGDRVATLLWNTWPHLVAYLAIPNIGAVIHTLNLRLHPNDLAYIAHHAEDKVLIVEDSLVPLYEQFRDRAPFRQVIVVGDATKVPGALSYAELIQQHEPDERALVDVHWNTPAFLLYTSGTTGKPKGVLYVHAQLALAALALTSTITYYVSKEDSIVLSVPMFHVASWALPYAGLIVGAKLVLPGPHPQPADLLNLLSDEQGTFVAGVPTVWHDAANLVENYPGRWTFSPKLRLILGGSAAPEALIRRWESFGVTVIHGWGMSEVLLGLQSHVKLADFPPEKRYELLLKQGMPSPFVEAKVLTFDGAEAPWDGQTMGELLVRGAWIADSYYRGESPDSFVDGWLRTGDVAVIDQEGYVKLVDRLKDVIKSGGEWISTIELENALMSHPAVEEAAVIGVPHERWQERPIGVVVLRRGQSTTAEELKEYLRQRFVRWWVPDAIVFVDELPKTSTGKLAKATLRERFRDWKWEERA